MERLRTRIAPVAAVVAAFAMLGAASAAAATTTPPKVPEAGLVPQAGAQRVTYRVGPLSVTPGQNRISNIPITDKPAVNGYITRFKPNLTYADGSVPKTNLVMFHHGVWINASRQDSTSSLGAERMFATGEEKTITAFPKGYGYRYKASDHLFLNYMIHNLKPDPMQLYITYEIDFIPDTAPEAASITPVRPIWMDVQNGSIYPVFDVHKGTGENGEFTYPSDDPNPYPNGRIKNMWQVDQDGVLISTAGHVHTGGLRTDLYLRRTGAHYQGQDCRAMKQKTARRRCAARAPAVKGNRAHLYTSEAKYWEPRGPVSWDVSMTGTKPGWRVQVHKGDMLEVTATYETKRASWYESMGIMVVYMADGSYGKDPYTSKVDWPGVVTHGHLPENSVHGGLPTGMPDARNLPNGLSVATTDPLAIQGFTYQDGDLRFAAPANRPPVVKEGQSLTFQLAQSDASQEIWHSLTSCAAPCNKSTGIAYPIANGKFQFDSGQLGTITPAVGRTSWTTPTDLPPGTYTYFCRIHPDMRGAFRVTK